MPKVFASDRGAVYTVCFLKTKKVLHQWEGFLNENQIVWRTNSFEAFKKQTDAPQVLATLYMVPRVICKLQVKIFQVPEVVGRTSPTTSFITGKQKRRERHLQRLHNHKANALKLHRSNSEVQ